MAVRVVVAGLEAGIVRVGGGFEGGLLDSVVEGVIPSGLAAVGGRMGSSLWRRIGGIFAV